MAGDWITFACRVGGWWRRFHDGGCHSVAIRLLLGAGRHLYLGDFGRSRDHPRNVHAVAACEAMTTLMRGGSPEAVIARYREHVAFNTKRLLAV